MEEATFRRLRSGESRPDTAGELTVTGGMVWSGHTQNPAALKASARVEGFHFRQSGWKVATDSPIALNYETGQAVLAPTILQTSLGAMHIGGRFAPDSLDLCAEIPAIDLQSLNADLSGQGHARFKVAGTSSRPRANGELVVNETFMSGSRLGDVRIVAAVDEQASLQASVEQDGDPEAEFLLALSIPASDSEKDSLRLDVSARQLDLGAPLTHVVGDSANGLLSMEGHFAFPSTASDDEALWRRANGTVHLDLLELQKPAL